MRLVPDSDGSGNVVVTMADGHEVRFGKNPDGTFAPPLGDFGHPHPQRSLLDHTGSRYDFAATGAMSKLTDATGLTQTYTYDASGHLSTAQNPTSGRSLHFTWSART
jgi:YD repeat-containing protein